MKLKLLALAFAFAGPSVCFADFDDARIRTEIYNENRVYSIYANVGRAALLQLEDDETLSVSPASILGIGDGEAWTLGVRGNNVVFKPVKDQPQTNLLLVTNKRTYAVDLKMAGKNGTPTYVLKFRYLDTEAKKAAAEAAAEAKRVSITAAARAERRSINTDYVWKGTNKLLAPTGAFDDGRFTRLIYNHAGEMPVFFKVLPDGSEALINSNIDKNDRSIVQLHEVIRTIRARLNDDVVEIINNNYTLPNLNTTGSSAPGVVRVEKE